MQWLTKEHFLNNL